MAIISSRLHEGTLKLGPSATAMDMSCQITNARITSAYSDDGDAVTTLCGDTSPAGRKLDGHKLEGTIVQDFDSTTSVVAYLWDNDLAVVAYEFTPNITGAPVITGTLMIEIPAETYGGDVNARLTSDFAWNLQEKPTFTPAAAGTFAADEAVTVAA